MIKYLKDVIQGKAPKGKKRSSKWRKVRKAFLKKHPLCEVCWSHKKVEVHHIIPFHVDPSLELEEHNLVTLCENKKYGVNCHLLVGHLGNYRKYNESVMTDAYLWNNKIMSGMFNVVILNKEDSDDQDA